jgi:hypothetical protein
MSDIITNTKNSLLKRLSTIDMTKIVEYTRKIDDIANLNKMLAPLYLRDFNVAQDIVNTMLSYAVRCDLETEALVDTAESIAYLDKAGDYLASKGIKDSSEARKRYVDIDPDVLAIKNIKAQTTAIVAFLKNKLNCFRQAHDDVKKMVYNEPYQTPYEGF